MIFHMRQAKATFRQWKCNQTDKNDSVRQTTEHDSKDAAIRVYGTHHSTVDERMLVRANAKDRISLAGTLGDPILNQ
jgi:hypothetical protein